MAENTYSSIDIAATALEFAISIRPFEAGADAVLKDADKISDWLVKKLAVTLTRKYRYFADEDPVDGEFPTNTYWYRLNIEQGRMSYVPSGGGDRVDAGWIEPDERDDLDTLQENWGLDLVPITDVPQWAL